MTVQGGWGLSELAAALPSWRPGPTRDWICTALATCVDVPSEDRIAAVDNDSMSACEKPMSSVGSYLAHLVRDAHSPGLSRGRPTDAGTP